MAGASWVLRADKDLVNQQDVHGSGPTSALGGELIQEEVHAVKGVGGTLQHGGQAVEFYHSPGNAKPPNGVGGCCSGLCWIYDGYIPAMLAVAKSLLTINQASRASPGTLATAK